MLPQQGQRYLEAFLGILCCMEDRDYPHRREALQDSVFGGLKDFLT